MKNRQPPKRSKAWREHRHDKSEETDIDELNLEILGFGDAPVVKSCNLWLITSVKSADLCVSLYGSLDLGLSMSREIVNMVASTRLTDTIDLYDVANTLDLDFEAEQFRAWSIVSEKKPTERAHRKFACYSLVLVV